MYNSLPRFHQFMLPITDSRKLNLMPDVPCADINIKRALLMIMNRLKFLHKKGIHWEEPARDADP